MHAYQSQNAQPIGDPKYEIDALFTRVCDADLVGRVDISFGFRSKDR
jgi:hypothetical protein